MERAREASKKLNVLHESSNVLARHLQPRDAGKHLGEGPDGRPDLEGEDNAAMKP